MAVHDRPAAFEGSDGMSYSVEIVVDEAEEGTLPFAAYILFLRWRRIGEQGVEGHLETAYLAAAHTAEEARAAVGALPLEAVRVQLELLLRQTVRGTRRWYEVMRDEGSDP